MQIDLHDPIVMSSAKWGGKFPVPLMAALLCAAPSLPLAAQSTPERTTVAARRLVDVAAGTLRTDVVVTIEKGRVLSVASRAAGGAVDLDLGDVTLVPGLIDCHTHLIGGEELSPLLCAIALPDPELSAQAPSTLPGA